MNNDSDPGLIKRKYFTLVPFRAAVDDVKASRLFILHAGTIRPS